MSTGTRDLECVENAARVAAEKVKHRMPDGAALLLAFADALALIINIRLDEEVK